VAVADTHKHLIVFYDEQAMFHAGMAWFFSRHRTSGWPCRRWLNRSRLSRLMAFVLCKNREVGQQKKYAGPPNCEVKLQHGFKN
jgi:hypothetical protein